MNRQFNEITDKTGTEKISGNDGITVFSFIKRGQGCTLVIVSTLNYIYNTKFRIKR